MRAPGPLHGHGLPDDLERGHPLLLALRPLQEKAGRGQHGSILNVLHFFISMKMLGNIFDNFVFSFVANMKHLLLE